MNWTTANMKLNDNQTQKICIDIKKLSVREGCNYVYWSQINIETILISIVFSSPPSSWRVFHIIYPLLDHLHHLLVDHPNPYLSTFPIRHPLLFSVSGGSRGNTVQRSSPHKCSQKSSCIAFNAVVAAFS